MNQPERVDPPSTEQRYFPSIYGLLMPLLLPVSVLIVGGVWRLRASGADAIALYLLKYTAGILLYLIVMRAHCVVRVSAEGIRGSSRTLTSWQEITAVAKHSNLFVAGFHVRSTYKNSIWIHQSVWKNPEFCRSVQLVAASSPLNRAIVTDRAMTSVARAQDREDS